jgi:DNA (cytosine-5)-methyltransferase 1
VAEDESTRETLYVPDRFEMMRDVGEGTLKTLVIAVDHSLQLLDDRFEDLGAAGRGGLMILRGNPGTGKSTFLDTVGLFRDGVTTVRISNDKDVAQALQALPPTDVPRIVVIEGREALLDVSEAALETFMHSINGFVRSPSGRSTLVVWPTNTDSLAEALASLGKQIGGSALLGVGDSIVHFDGPPRSQYVRIGELTVAALNDSASLLALGVTNDRAVELATQAESVGDFLALLRGELRKNGARVKKLLQVEQPRVWVVVIAGNDPEGDVAAVTRGEQSHADVPRLMSSTGANIVAELKEEPDTLGILGTVLDARVMHVEQIAALAIARQFGNERLRALMRAEGLSTARDRKAVERVRSSELGVLLGGGKLGVKRRGKKAGGSTTTAFAGLAKIAQTNDGLLNRAIAEALVEAELADGYELEKELSGPVKYFSDIAVRQGDDLIRIEVMWRHKTGRAQISNYVLTKLGNYAKAVGLL